MDINKNKLTSLMKQKYGTVKSSAVKFTAKDDLYSMFRKLAVNIYKNGEWTIQDEINAVDTLMRNREGFGVGIEEIIHKNSVGEETHIGIEIQPASDEEKLELGENRIGKCIPYTAVTMKITHTGDKILLKTGYYLLDKANKVGTKHNQHWWLFKSKKTFGYGNLDRAIGYDKLQRDLFRIFDERKDELEKKGIFREDVELLMERLTNPKYASARWRTSFFTKSRIGNLTDEYLETLERNEDVRYWEIPPELSGSDSKPFSWRDISGSPESLNKLNLDIAPYRIPINGMTYFVSPERVAEARKENKILDFVEKYVLDIYNILELYL